MVWGGLGGGLGGGLVVEGASTREREIVTRLAEEHRFFGGPVWYRCGGIVRWFRGRFWGVWAVWARNGSKRSFLGFWGRF